MANKNNELPEKHGQVARAMDVIINGVNTICLVMKELKNLTSYETTVYHEEHYIIDIEDKIKKQLKELENMPR